MKQKIIEQKQNILFNRKEVVIEIEANTNPSFSESEKIISETFKTEPETFKIKKIQGRFGSNIFQISANIYDSKKEKDGIERKTKKEKEAEAKALEEKKKAQVEAKKAKEDALKKATESKQKEEIKTE